MKSQTTIWGALLVLLSPTMIASAYHYDHTTVPASDWDNTASGMATLCESLGPTDPINPSEVANEGIGGLCYASSQSGLPFEASLDGDDFGSVKPTCWTSLAISGVSDCVAGPDFDWFARIGSNNRSCDGYWGEFFYYKEVIAYYGGSGDDAMGVSGHVTFFINEPGTTGSFLGAVHTSNPITTTSNCTDAPDIGK